jgi:hypothetical protein
MDQESKQARTFGELRDEGDRPDPDYLHGAWCPGHGQPRHESWRPSPLFFHRFEVPAEGVALILSSRMGGRTGDPPQTARRRTAPGASPQVRRVAQVGRQSGSPRCLTACALSTTHALAPGRRRRRRTQPVAPLPATPRTNLSYCWTGSEPLPPAGSPSRRRTSGPHPGAVQPRRAEVRTPLRAGALVRGCAAVAHPPPGAAAAAGASGLGRSSASGRSWRTAPTAAPPWSPAGATPSSPCPGRRAPGIE